MAGRSGSRGGRGGRRRNPTADPATEPTRKPLKSTGQREAVQSTRGQMPDLNRRRQGAKRTNRNPLPHNQISKEANSHRLPPDPYRYVDIKLPTQVVGQHRNGTHSIQFKPPSQVLPKGLQLVHA